jgi:Protein of unknown function (DUF1207)
MNFRLVLPLLLAVQCTVPSLHANERIDSLSGWHFVSSGLLFRPLAANTFEARVGILERMNHEALRLDIGNSIDLVQYRHPTTGGAIAMGVDFFTYTKLRSETNFHFPVDAIDYLFGVNFSGVLPTLAGPLETRLRISHISAHMADGHFEWTYWKWRDGRNPQIYSREFVDLVIAWEPSTFSRNARCYIGSISVFHIDPSTLPKQSWYGGIEYHRSVAEAVHLYASYQPSLINIDGWSVRHEAQTGVKVGQWNGRGVNVYYGFFSGKSIHGEYFDVDEEYTALGINFEF